jgi:branched-chain amino acid transport system substrate-binding protein
MKWTRLKGKGHTRLPRLSATVVGIERVEDRPGSACHHGYGVAILLPERGEDRPESPSAARPQSTTVKRYRIQLLTLSLGVALTVSCVQRQQPVRIGYLLPLTGLAAQWGSAQRDGALLAVAETNDSGGVGGRTLDVIFMDSSCEVAAGLESMKKLIHQYGVPAVIGATCDAVTAVVAPMASSERVLLLCPLSTTTALAHAGPFLLRLMPSEALQGPPLAEWVASEGHRRAAVVTSGEPGASEILRRFGERLKTLGGNVVVTARYRTENLMVVVAEIRAASPDAVVCALSAQQGGAFLRALREEGLTLPVYGTSAWDAAVLADAAGDASDNARYLSAGVPGGTTYERFAARFRRAYAANPSPAATAGYEAVMLLKASISDLLERGLSVSGENLRGSLLAMAGFEGVTGTVVFDETGERTTGVFERIVASGRRRRRQSG